MHFSLVAEHHDIAIMSNMLVPVSLDFTEFSMGMVFSGFPQGSWFLVRTGPSKIVHITFLVSLYYIYKWYVERIEPRLIMGHSAAFIIAYTIHGYDHTSYMNMYSRYLQSSWIAYGMFTVFPILLAISLDMSTFYLLQK